MTEEQIKKLESLRHFTLASAKGIPEIMKVLAYYYPAGTKVIINKDCWSIEEEK